MKKLAIAISVALASGGAFAAADATIDNITVSKVDSLAATINSEYGEINKSQDPKDNASLVKLADSSENKIMSKQNSVGFNSQLSVIDLKNGSDFNQVSVTQSGSNNASLVDADSSSDNTVTIEQASSSNETIALMKNVDKTDTTVKQTGTNNFAGLELDVYHTNANGERNTITIEQLSNNKAFVEMNSGYSRDDVISIKQQGNAAIADVLVKGSSVSNDITITQMDNDQAYVEVTGSSWHNDIIIDQESDNLAFTTVNYSDSNYVMVDQDGSGNKATVVVDGSANPWRGDNKVDVKQVGDSNVAKAKVKTGRSNDLDIIQNGFDNKATTSVTRGDNNNVFVTQQRDNNKSTVDIKNGSSNDVTVMQRDSRNISSVSIENGDFNGVDIMQDWNSEALVTLVNSSNNNVAGLAGQSINGVQIEQGSNELAIVNMTNSNGNAVFISQDK